MANRYNDQDYPRYNERDDRYDSRSESRGAERNRSGGGRTRGQNERDEGYYGMSYNRDFGTGQQAGEAGYSGGYFGSDFGRGYSSEDHDFDDFQSNARPSRSYTGGFGRNTRNDRDDYTLYGYDRDSQYSSGSDEERGYYNRGGDYGYGSNYGSSGSNFDRMNAADYTRGNRGDYGRGSSSDRSQRGQGGNYRGDYMNSERGWETEERGGTNQNDRGWWDKTTDEISSWFGDDEAARRRERDMRQSESGGQTSHRGKGPKNYRRSDERIKEDINDRLTDYPYLDASDIDVEVSNGEVVLTGTVESRYAKRMAEDIAEDVSGVSNVENRLRVRQNTSNYGSNTGTSTSSTGTNTGSMNTGTSGSLTSGSTTGTSGSTSDTSLGTSTGSVGSTSSATGTAGDTSTGTTGDANTSTTTGRSRSKTA